MMQENAITAIPELAAIFNGADNIHVVSVDCRKSLREFLSAVLSYMPGWMRFLYRVRWVFVRLLGARQDGVPASLFVAPDGVPFAKGEQSSIFTVIEAREDSFWIGKATDTMITGYLGVIAEPLESGANRFHIVTGAKFLHWTGSIYFAIIKPFHNLVVACMAREGAAVLAGTPEDAVFVQDSKA